MTRTITDEDAEAIAAALAKRLGRRDVATPPPPPVLSREQREAAIAKGRALLKRRGIRSGHGAR